MFEPVSLKSASTENENRPIPAIFFATLLVALVIGRVIGSIIFPVYDDAYITYRYAENLATGVGFVYHAKDWVLGATCPAFGVFVGLLFKLGLPVPISIQIINVFCDAAILGLSYKVLGSTSFFRDNERLAILSAVIFGFFFSISPILTRICVGGMEVNIFLLGSIGAIYLYHRGAKIPAIAIAAGCYFLRPEGVVLVGILSGLELVTTKSIKALRLPAVAVAIMTPPLLLIYHFYGHVLPQSVTAKSHVVKKSVFVTGKGLVAPDPLSLVLLPFAIWGAISFVQSGGLKKHVFLRTLLVWYVLYLSAYLVARPQIWSWYAEPIQYVQLIFAALGIANIVGRLGASRNSSRVGKAASPTWGVVAGALAICFWALLLVKQKPSGVTRYVYQPLQQWSQSADRKKSTILAEDIGAVGYFSGAYIYDTAALVWPEALKFKNIEEMIRAHKPDYLFLNADQESIEMVNRLHSSIPYKPVQRFSPDNEKGLKMDPKLYTTDWKQDYIIFQRVAK